MKNTVIPLPDLTDKETVQSYMKSATSEQEWNLRCDHVKAANSGYPEWWYPAIIMSGICSQTSSKW